MALQVVRFLAVLFAALALGPALAHLLELPNKIRLPAEQYLTVQQNYRGWSRLAIVVIGALLSIVFLTVMVREDPTQRLFAVVAGELDAPSHAMGVFPCSKCCV